VLVRKAARIRSKTIYERLDQKGVGFSEGPGSLGGDRWEMWEISRILIFQPTRRRHGKAKPGAEGRKGL
jgi:hypothetical protein